MAIILYTWLPKPEEKVILGGDKRFPCFENSINVLYNCDALHTNVSVTTFSGSDDEAWRAMLTRLVYLSHIVVLATRYTDQT